MTRTTPHNFGNYTLKSIKDLRKRNKTKLTLLKLAGVKLSPEERGQQAGKFSKSLKSALQFIWVYQRHFAIGASSPNNFLPTKF